jgi:hypothetical protein
VRAVLLERLPAQRANRIENSKAESLAKTLRTPKKWKGPAGGQKRKGYPVMPAASFVSICPSHKKMKNGIRLF